ncbi:NAD-dependent epimerase/dehydratase family protein [Streptomyces sp. ST2-7A]|uniref:NAD-dependent epimerase/dehydratase family protein n=1 Tax=Streptomyces sp. ST2-7A TaxID=2907214 RepID=UPI001F229AFE|nr:NAD-dependent epimerase/dehydratase family protein [Streptomyces sp. ST2-7A]MCE7081665.1 NAD-dependent epimerase/dehydratase family protein [Streptomyces sp. ST2-7A]
MNASPTTDPGEGLRVAVIGATGNIGTSLLRALAADPAVAAVRGLARRTPDRAPDKTSWWPVDLGDPRPTTGRALEEALRGMDAVVHLGWLMQPARDPLITWRTNVLGTERVLRAVARVGVPAVLCASSVAAYTSGPPPSRRRERPVVREDAATHGRPTAAYSREKAYQERLLDVFERDHPEVRVVRMRPAFLLKRESASQQRRLFLGPFVPGGLFRPGLLPLLPNIPGLRVQVLHTDDAAEAWRLALHRPVRGAFNLAAEPVLDTDALANLLDTTPRTVPLAVARAAVTAAWSARLTPASPALFDTMVRLPVMDCSRARDALGWTPRHDARETVAALLGGLRDAAGGPTAPLRARLPGGRLEEVVKGPGRVP